MRRLLLATFALRFALQLLGDSDEALDVALARRQHRAYEQRLSASGCTVQRLPAEPDLPDAVFVEDAAVATADALQ